MALDKNLERLKYDSRMLEWNLRNGVIKESDLKNHIQNLEDVSSNAVKLELEGESKLNGSGNH